MECSVDRFFNGCTYVYWFNILVSKGGIKYEKHGNASTINRYCVDASVLEDQIE